MKNKFLFSLIIAVAVLGNTDARAQWAPSGGPEGGNVWCFLESQNTLYAGTAGGVYALPQNASNWSALTNGLSGFNVNALALHNGALFAGTDSGIFSSSDDGGHWAAHGLAGHKVKVLTDISGVLIAGLGDYLGAGVFPGVYVSTDNGTTWTQSDAGLSDWSEYIYGITVIGQTLFLATGNGVFTTSINNVTWESSSTILADSAITAMDTCQGNLFVSTYNEVYMSSNKGATWQLASNRLPNRLYSNSFVAHNSALYLCTDSGAFVTTDEGVSWSVVPHAGMANIFMNTMFFAGGALYAGTAGGVFSSSNNGAAWNVFNSGLNIASVYSLAANGSVMFAGDALGGIFRSTDDGMTWELKENGIGPYIDALSLIADSGNVYVGLYGYGVYSSMDNGENWTDDSNGLTNLTTLRIAKVGGALFQLTGAISTFDTTLPSLTRSTDAGAHWSRVNQGLPPTFVNCLAANGATIYIGLAGDGVFMTTDYGNTWDSLENGLTRKYIIALAASGNNVIAQADSGLFLSTNQGMTWNPLNGVPLSAARTNTFVTAGNTILAGTSNGGLFVSTDNGVHWFANDAGLPNLNVLSICITQQESVYLGLANSGVWRRSLAQVTSVDEPLESAIPATMGILQNYPNPFSSSTTISFSLPQHENVTSMKVYDALGREVADLSNQIALRGKDAQGRGTAVFDAEGLQEGVYFYRLTAGATMYTGTMAVVK